MFPTGNEKGDEMLEFWLWVYVAVCFFQAVCGLVMREEGEEGWGARRQTKWKLKHRASREWTVVDEEC